MRCWSCSNVCLADFANTAPSALCLPSAAASAEWGMQLSPVLLGMNKGELIFGFILFLASMKMPLLSDWGEEMNRFSYLKHPRWMVFYPCCRDWLNLVYGFEKLFSGTSLACRSGLEQQVLTTEFPPMLMPLWFAGFGVCFCLPAFHRSPQHMEPSCDFTRCVGGRAVCC